MSFRILSIFAVATLCAVSIAAQNKIGNISQPKTPVNASRPTDSANKTGDKISDKLTEAELSDLANLATRANSTSDELQARLKVFLDVTCTDCSEAYAVKLAADDARKYWRDVARPAQQAYLTRLAEIQKAHDCVGCALRDGAFVRPTKAEKPE